MKPGGKRRRVAGIVAAAAVAPACATSPQAAPALACTTVPVGRAPAAGAGGQRSGWDMPPVTGSLAGIAARSPGSAVAVGWTGNAAHGRALVALWNGTAWRTLSSRALPRVSFLFAVALFPGGAWAVGEQGNGDNGGQPLALMVRVTGATVRQVPVPPAFGLTDVAATSATDAWAVGGAPQGAQEILHWNGTAWTRAQLPAADAGGIEGVAATSRTNAWAVIYPESGRLPKIAHWNGSRWADVAAPDIGMRYRLGGVAAASARNVWAAGSARSGALILHWDGLRWTCAALSPIGNGRRAIGNVAVSASSADNAWVAGVYSSYGQADRVVALHWNGHRWTQVMTRLPGQPSYLYYVQGVAVIPQSGGAWAVGSADDVRTLMLHWNGTA
jgi:hypothetical protein